jgi:dethiobiotin synthetase
LKGLFLTGSGTDVGKTLVMRLLIGDLRSRGIAVRAIKPVITGFDPAEAAGSDTGLILEALGLPLEEGAFDQISPWRFYPPISPDMAAYRAGAPLDLEKIAGFCRSSDEDEVLLVEGIGGVMAPLTGQKTVLDLMVRLGLPVLLVTGSYLGALSHGLTAVRTVQSSELSLAGIVISESVESPVPLNDTAAAIGRFVADTPILTLPRLETLEEGTAYLSPLTAKIAGL